MRGAWLSRRRPLSTFGTECRSRTALMLMHPGGVTARTRGTRIRHTIYGFLVPMVTALALGLVGVNVGAWWLPVSIVLAALAYVGRM